MVEKHHSIWRFYVQKAIVLDYLKENDVKLPKPESSKNTVFIAMSDDFNTAKAIGQYFELQKKVYSDVKKQKITDDTLINVAYMNQASEALGVFGEEPNKFFETVENLMLKHLPLSKKDIEDKLNQRKTARSNKDFKTADAIRSELLSHGIEIQDLENDKVSWCISPQFD